MTINLEIKKNPEYEKLVPALLPAEKEALRKLIKENGFYLPIIVNENGEILDGHNRVDIGKEEGIKPPYDIRKSDNKLEEKKFVIEVNLQRRQLNAAQKAELGFELEKIESEKARLRQLLTIPQKGQQGFKSVSVSASNDTNTEKGKTTEIIARRIGLSPSTYDRYKKVRKYGTEEQLQRLWKGKSTINQEFVRTQRDIGRLEYLESCKDIVLSGDSSDDNYRLILGDFIEKTSEIPDNSVDLINTDFLYEDTQYNMMLHEELAKLSIRVLKPGGVLAFITGHSILDKVIIIFDKYSINNRIGEKGLKFWHPFVLEHSSNHSRLYGRHIIPLQKPILMYVKGEKLNENVVCNTVGDVIKSSRPGKEFHDMQQSTEEAEHFIKNYTLEDHSVVLDPMMGSATTGIVALQLKRKFIGIEKDENRFKIAEARLKKLSI